MSKIERRSPQDGADRWSWPAGLHPVLRQVLSRRPIAGVHELELGLKALTPVGRFDSLGPAVALLIEHRHRPIVIVGDFDADGATSAAVATLTLRRLGFEHVQYFIPDRFELGYGLTPEVVERLRPHAPSLIVTVDNGITSHAGVDAARAAGIDVLVTDHHLPPAVLPRANAIVNPNLPGDTSGGRHLAGVGVLFYLLAALGKALDRPNAVLDYIDLVALGTVADLVPLDQLNRILVEQGLKRIRAGRCRPGLAALARTAGVRLEDITSATLGYQIGPRLNAAGRLDDMSVGVRCLVTDDPDEAAELAERLDALNRERRALEARMKAEAIDLVGPSTELDGALPHVVCLAHRDWHEGLVGLVASRIKERYCRPTFAFAPAGNDRLKGSGRSIAGFHLRDALAAVAARHPGMLERFGGHAMAAGLTLSAAAFDDFKLAIERVGRESLTEECFAERVLTDGELRPDDLTVEVAALLRNACPWGQGFPEPCFDGRFEVLDHALVKDAHLKMKVRPAGGGGRPIDAIAFHRTDPPVDRELTLAFRLDINDYWDPPTVQLIVEHME